MAYGLVVNNSAGDLVFDSSSTTRINYQYHSSGSVTTGSSTYYTSGGTYDKEYGSVTTTVTGITGRRILFLRPKNYTGVVYFTGSLIGTTLNVRSFPGNVSFDYLVFEDITNKTDDLSLGDYGLHVFNDLSELTFSSNFLCARLRAIISTNASFEEETGGRYFIQSSYRLSRETNQFAYTVPGGGLDIHQEERFEYVAKADTSLNTVTVVENVTFAQALPGYSSYSRVTSAFPTSLIVDAAGFVIGT